MIAYIILAHNNTNQLKKLIKKINDKKCIIIIHLDKKLNKKYFNNIKEYFHHEKNVYFLEKRFNCVWGDFSIINATNKCIEKLLNMDIEFTHAVLLSGSDFPIKSRNFINNFFQENQDTDFIECECDNRYKDNERFELYYFKFAKFFKNKLVQNFMFRLQYKISYTLRIKRKHPKFDKVYYGGQWWILSKKTLLELYEFIKSNEDYVDFYKNTNIPDEFFYQTIIGNLFNNRNKGYNMHYVEWEDSNSFHPIIITSEKKDTLLNSNKLFARKFDDKVDHKIIEYLDCNL